MEETYIDLLKDLGLEGQEYSASTQLLLAGESKYVRDLRMNVKAVLEVESLNRKETSLLALSIAVNNNNTILQKAFEAKAKENGATAEELAEAVAIASLLSANNVFYRFRHFVDKESYNTMRAGLRMNIMARPVLGKEFFELASLAVSAVNGCEMCVKSHEASVLEAGSSEARVWDAVRLAAVITSLCKVIHS
jgi:lipoyl-dependent peroxiredoxin subunit D